MSFVTLGGYFLPGLIENNKKKQKTSPGIDAFQTLEWKNYTHFFCGVGLDRVIHLIQLSHFQPNESNKARPAKQFILALMFD